MHSRCCPGVSHSETCVGTSEPTVRQSAAFLDFKHLGWFGRNAEGASLQAVLGGGRPKIPSQSCTCVNMLAPLVFTSWEIREV